MKTTALLAALAVALTTANAQPFLDYGFEREFPACLDQMQETLTYPMAWGNSPIKSFDLWRAEARHCVLDAMQLAPPASTDYQMEVVATERREGYEARKLRFNLSAFTRAEAYYLVPDGKGPFPTVILLHDHGGHYMIGKEKMVRPFACADSIVQDAEWWQTQCYGGQYVGDYLARQGYVVFVTDALYWGDRGRREGRRVDTHMRMAGNLMELGYCWSGIITYDDIYTADCVATLPEVDKDRIGCMGHSMGGYRTWMLAAMSDKVKVGVAVCWMVTTDVQCNLRKTKRDKIEKRNDKFLRNLDGQNPCFFFARYGGKHVKKRGFFEFLGGRMGGKLLTMASETGEKCLEWVENQPIMPK